MPYIWVCLRKPHKLKVSNIKPRSFGHQGIPWRCQSDQLPPDPHDRSLEEVLRLKHTGLKGALKLSSLGLHSLRQSRRQRLMRAQMYCCLMKASLQGPPRQLQVQAGPLPWSLAQPRCGLKACPSWQNSTNCRLTLSSPLHLQPSQPNLWMVNLGRIYAHSLAGREGTKKQQPQPIPCGWHCRRFPGWL